MTTPENEYAAVAILQSAQERLLQKRSAVETQLAIIALHLTEIEDKLETEPKPITATINTHYNEYHDGGYIGGYVTSHRYPQRRLKITTTQFDTAYLLAVANQGSPISSLNARPEREWSHPSNSSISLENVIIDGVDIHADIKAASSDEPDIYHHEQDKHSNAVRDMFTEAGKGAVEIISKLREQAEASNPYADIPIKINHDELVDALLRREILAYCKTIDPDFSVEQLN